MELVVTVKAYPTVTSSQGETVCVAGVRLDTAMPEWVRLWPVGFRELPQTAQFSKWQVISIEANRSNVDSRVESYRPNLSTLVLKQSLPSKNRWSARRTVLGNLLGEWTLCDLLRAQGTDVAPSLAAVRVRPGAKVTIRPGQNWDPTKQLQADLAAQPNLLREKYLAVLRPPKYQVEYRWQCLASTCGGHTHNSCDWEVGAAAINFAQRYPAAEVPRHLELKFGEQILGDDKETFFFVGNQHQRPSTFMVLGAFYPKVI